MGSPAWKCNKVTFAQMDGRQIVPVTPGFTVQNDMTQHDFKLWMFNSPGLAHPENAQNRASHVQRRQRVTQRIIGF